MRRGPARPLAGRARSVRALGTAGRDHRAGHRRRRYRDRRGRPGCRGPPGARRARDRAGPCADRSPAMPSSTSGSQRPRPIVGMRRLPAPRRPSATGCPNAAWTRAPSSSPCSAPPTCRLATKSSTSTTRRSARTPSPGRATGRRSCGSRARPRRWLRRPTATRPSGPSTRGWAPPCPSRRPPETCRSPGRDPWASRIA